MGAIQDTITMQQNDFMKIKPYKINVPQMTLDDMRTRLARTRWTDEIEGAMWDYGTNLQYLRELCHYWHNDFNWRKQESVLNDFANFQTEIDGLKIHFIHERGRGATPIPIVLTHGFPASFYRFYKLIPFLILSMTMMVAGLYYGLFTEIPGHGLGLMNFIVSPFVFLND